MDIVCFYIISYTTISCITTVYRIYGAETIGRVVRRTTRIEQVVTVKVSTTHIAQAEVSISRVTFDIAGSQPNPILEKTVTAPTTMPYTAIDFFHPIKYFMILSIVSPNFKKRL